MHFDPQSFEYDETPDIAINDGEVGKLNMLIYAVILAACVYYLFTAWSPSDTGPLSKAVKTSVLMVP
jgi:hypothetical protein